MVDELYRAGLGGDGVGLGVRGHCVGLAVVDGQDRADVGGVCGENADRKRRITESLPEYLHIRGKYAP